MNNTRGNFGHDVVWSFPYTFRSNKKGKMDKEEFEKFLFISIVPLCPDAADVVGKRVSIKLDSGPGQMNANLLVCLCLQGIYVFPVVPNTTSITQETDCKYGLFKTKFCIQTSEYCSDCLLFGKKLNLAQSMVGMFVFGGTDPETGVDTYVDV